MTPQERMAELIEHGAAIQLLAPYPRLTLTLAGALWLTDPTRLRWCAIFPQHQGHIHETEYDEIKVIHDRDIAFYHKGEMTFYVCPYEESEEDLDAIRDALGAWRVLLGKYTNVDQFADFLRNA